MDTWMEKDYPWLINEKKKIKEFVVELEKPYLGFCLGCQLVGFNNIMASYFIFETV